MLNAKLILGVLLATTACSTTPNPAFCGDGFCSDPALPFCDVDGRIGGQVNTCIAVSCTPNTFETCRGDDSLVCNAAGTNFDIVECDTGCGAAGCNDCVPNTTRCEGAAVITCDANSVKSLEECATSCIDGPTPHCAHLSPKHVPDACDTPASMPTLAITANTTLDTSIDTNCTGGVVTQSGGPEICVVRYGSISVGVATTLRVVGRRALALVGDSDISIAGIVELSAVGRTDGPGADLGLPGVGGAGGGANSAGGGGGGGALGGAAGGTSTMTGGAANAGVALRSAATLVAGGRGGAVSGTAGDRTGGGGGGAATIASCRGTVTVEGRISANGGGGLGGNDPTLPFSGTVGAGGGAGGKVVLQGIQVIVTGRLYANGAGGGAGCTFLGGSSCTNGDNGEDGKNSLLIAAGGLPGPINNNRQGGAGGASAIQGGVPVPGGAPMGVSASGGGGGSIGILKVLVPSGVTPLLSPMERSPDIDPTETATVR